MTFQVRPARRSSVPLVIGLAGPSGGGKTRSAIALARGLAGDDGRIILIDTENGRSQMYADIAPPWEWLDFHAPFTPERYVQALTAAEQQNPAVIVLDSISHEYDGQGGMNDIVETYLQQHAGDDERKRSSLSFAAWAEAKNRHKRLVTAILRLRCHLIVCMRAQDKIELVKNSKGKLEAIPKRTMIGVDGWEPISERRLPYELTTSLLLLPSAPGVPHPIKLPEPLRDLIPLERPLDEQVGAALANWASPAGGQAEPLIDPDTVKLLAELRRLAGVNDDWLRAELNEVGVQVSGPVTLATIKTLTQTQAQQLQQALQATLDTQSEGQQLTTSENA